MIYLDTYRIIYHTEANLDGDSCQKILALAHTAFLVFQQIWPG